LSRCSGCDGVEIEDALVDGKEGVDIDDDELGGGDCDIGDFEVPGGSKESKANSTSEVHGGGITVNRNQIESNYSYGEAEALTDEIEEEPQVVGEVLRIKEVLRNSQDESEKVLFDSLRKLQLMALTVDILTSTQIGKAVNVLRKHGSKDISNLGQTLVCGWRNLVDEWYKTTKAITGDTQGGTPDSVNLSNVDEEEGLPSPPLDDLAFFTAPPSMELSQFFDSMDDDGNPRNNGGLFTKNRESERKASSNSGRRPSAENQNVMKRKQQSPHEVNNAITKENKSQQWRRQDGGDAVKPNKPLNSESGPGRPPRVAVEQKANESKLQQKPDRGFNQRKLPTGQEDKPKCSDEVSVQRKLEATKRKLQESYQQAENAKKQRKVQVMELHDIPKQRTANKNSNGRSFNRNWANGR
jgi:hypothetical protein